MTRGVDSDEKTFHTTSGNECKFSAKPAGCRENHFYLPAFTSPAVISTSPKKELTSSIDFTFPLSFEFLKNHHLPVGQVKNIIH